MLLPAKDFAVEGSIAAAQLRSRETGHIDAGDIPALSAAKSIFHFNGSFQSGRLKRKRMPSSYSS